MMTDHSGTISSGGASQKAADAFPGRVALILHNPHTTDDLYFNFTADAAVAGTGGSMRLAAGAYVALAGPLCPPDQINVVGATTGRPYTVKDA